MAARILVVEDSPPSLDLIVYLLGKAGHATLSATNGKEALEIARREDVDLVLMDMQMPVMDGYQAGRLFRSDPVLRARTLVAVTAFAMVGDRENVLKAGFDGVITKPILPETFVQEVDSFLPSTLRSEWSLEPSSAPAAAAVPRPAAPGPEAGGALVLVVDNDAVSRSLTTTILSSHGWRITSVGSAEDAIEIMARERPDLLVTDLNMPDGSGYELISRMRTDARLAGVPALVLTSSAWDSGEPERARQAGADAFLRRPADPREVLAAAEECMKGARRESGWHES